MKRPWTPEEDAIIQATYREGALEAHMALREAGYPRPYNQIRSRAGVLGLVSRRRSKSEGAGTLAPMLWPAYTVTQREALSRLAESNPSPRRYAEAKARILGRPI